MQIGHVPLATILDPGLGVGWLQAVGTKRGLPFHDRAALIVLNPWEGNV